MSFYSDVHDASYPRETPEEVFAYYQEQYPGSKTLKSGKVIYTWQGKLADDLSQMLGIKRDSVMRRFQGARAGKISKRQEDEYQALGEMLPPKPPEGGYYITGVVYVKYSEECVEREVDEVIEGSDADALAAESAYSMTQGFVNYYQTGNVGGKGPGSAGCPPPELHVTAID